MTTQAATPVVTSSPQDAASRANTMLTAPILPTLVRLSLPNMLAMMAMALVTIAETGYVGTLGTPSLAGLALVFPPVMLQQMMFGGAMGGGVSSGNQPRLAQATNDALHLWHSMRSSSVACPASSRRSRCGCPANRSTACSADGKRRSHRHSPTQTRHIILAKPAASHHSPATIRMTGAACSELP